MNHSLPNPETRDEYLAACRGFAAALPRYLSCSAQIQGVVRDLVQLWNDCTIAATERDRIVRALTVTVFGDTDDRLLDQQEASANHQPNGPEVAGWRARMEHEEDVFVANLKRMMCERQLTQAELAERAGLSQPAISMMLARKYRPQRRTVRLLAQVLGVAEHELWPREHLDNKDVPLPNSSKPAGLPPAPTADRTPYATAACAERGTQLAVVGG